MKILITGSHGQLGNELQKILGCGYSELGKINTVYDKCDVTAVDVDELDITDTAAVNLFVSAHRPDVIINCAAMTNVNACETELGIAYKVNAVGPRNLAAAAEACGAKMVQVSTDYVFPGDGNVPYTEMDLCAPQSIYGKSKLLGEKYVAEQCHRYFIVRTAWLYGYIGKNFVKTVMNVSKEKGAMTVVNDQLGNPTSAVDLAHHILLLAASEEYGIYHCTCEGECSWYDFAKRILELSGIPCDLKPCTTDEYPTPAKRPAYSHLRNLALESSVGNHMRNWETALQEYIINLKAMEENK